MRKEWKKMICCFLLACLCLTACGNATTEETKNQNTEKTPISTEQEKETIASGEEESEYPLCDEKKEISVWRTYSNQFVEDLNDLPTIQLIEEKTNVHVNWNTVSLFEAAEKFGLLVASGDLPDVMSGGTYTGGNQKGIDDGIFLDCDDLVHQYMPNYLAVATSNPTTQKKVTGSDGKYHILKCIFGNDDMKAMEEPAWNGLAIRQDWLDELGLEAPVTIDDWHEVLVAFRDQKGASAPLSIGQYGHTIMQPFMTAYGVTSEFYTKEDGTIGYGPLEEGYRQWVELFHQWYEEGLIDPNFITVGWGGAFEAPNEYIYNDKTGAFNVSFDYLIDGYYTSGRYPQDTIYVTPLMNPVEKEGDQPKAFYEPNITAGDTLISAECEDPVLVAKWLDYWYSEEVMEYQYYGIEGETYMVQEDGTRTYTELITANPEGYTPSDALSLYSTAQSGLGFYNWEYLHTLTPNVEEKVAGKMLWTSHNTDMNLYVDDMTYEEQIEFNSVYTDIQTLVQESTINFIIGSEPLDKYDEFIDKLYKYGIETCLKIRQAQADRYANR